MCLLNACIFFFGRDVLLHIYELVVYLSYDVFLVEQLNPIIDLALSGMLEFCSRTEFVVFFPFKSCGLNCLLCSNFMQEQH